MSEDLTLLQISADALNTNFTEIENAVNGKAEKNGDATQKFKVADAIEPTEAINKGQLDNAVSAETTYIDDKYVATGTTIYVATTGSDATGDGKDLSPYATLTKAVESLDGKTLLGQVTIQIADGAYSHTSAIMVSHPQADFITIQGNISNRESVVLNFIDCLGIMYESVGGGRKRQITGVPNLRYLTLNGNRTNNIDHTGIYFVNSSIFVDNVCCKNFNTGIHALGSSPIYLDNVLLTLNVSDGLQTEMSFIVVKDNSSITYNGGNGILSNHSYIAAQNRCTVNNNTNYGIWAVDQSFVDFMNSTNTVSANTAGALFAYSGSIIHKGSATVSGTLSPALGVEGNFCSYVKNA